MDAEFYFMEGESVPRSLDLARRELAVLTGDQRMIMSREIEQLNDSFQQLSTLLIYFMFAVILVGAISAMI